MHETLSLNFKGYIDNFYSNDGQVRLSGWIVSTHNRDDITLCLDIGHEVVIYNFNERNDVASFYNTFTYDFVNCGFDVSVPAKSNNIKIYAKVNDQKENIFDLSLNNNRAYTPSTQLVNESTEIKINNKIIPSLVVVDNFYSNPDDVRRLALSQDFSPDLRYHKGKRTAKKFLAQGTKELFESLIGCKITNWINYEYNGIFQYCTAEDPLVYHVDTQSYAAAVYLPPDAPTETGTTFYRSKNKKDVRKIDVNDNNYSDVFKGGYYDKTKFETVDIVGNVYNRLVIWDSRLIHSASQYFGTNKEDSRLFHLFFFDIEE